MTANRRREGNIYEKIARDYLSGEGYEILATNFSTPYGEIDIVAQYKNILVFVEVKGGFTMGGLRPAVRVGLQKRTRLFASANVFLDEYHHQWEEVRFDIIEVRQPQTSTQRITHIKGAITFEEPF